jgi:hypothetical protein
MNLAVAALALFALKPMRRRITKQIESHAGPGRT